MHYNLSVRLFTAGKCFGPGLATLLTLVRERHSLRAAAAEMGMAYSKAWRILRDCEQALGFPLLDSTTGGRNGGERGSLVVEIAVRPHKLFRRSGSDLQLELPLTIAEAALGCTVFIPTLRNPQELKIPEGTQSGTIFRLKGCGVKKLRANDNGDLYVKVVVEVPKSLTREQKDLLHKLDGCFEIKQFPRKKEYRDKN